ncbi:MAG: hypothetical protein FJW27_16245 [Acidimicrobiia bacterium]|nr:hypothetical protein [Acidimicrobiia bacterium]
MKDGRTYLAHKAEHAVDLETGAIVGITVQGADQRDTTTIQETVPEAAKQLGAITAVTGGAIGRRDRDDRRARRGQGLSQPDDDAHADGLEDSHLYQ